MYTRAPGAKTKKRAMVPGPSLKKNMVSELESGGQSILPAIPKAASSYFATSGFFQVVLLTLLAVSLPPAWEPWFLHSGI